MRRSPPSSATPALLACCLLAIPAPCRAADGKEEAKAHFANGVDLFKNGDFDAALIEFRTAYDAKPHFAVRYNIGITLYKLHLYGESHEELVAYLDEGGDDVPAEKRVEVEEIIGKLEALLGTLTVDCAVEGAKLVVDGEPRISWSLRLDVGSHEVEVAAPGHETFKTTVDLAGGAAVEIHADLVPEQGGGQEPGPVEPPGTPGKGVPPAAFWSMMGATGALAVAAGITGGLVIKQDRDYADLAFEDDWRSAQARGKRLMIAADVLWPAAAAAGIATIVMAFLTDFDREKKVSVLPVGAPLGLAVTGSFP